MKLKWLTIPVGCLFACLGGLMWVQARARSETPYSTSTDIITNQPRHLVTQQMIVETDAEANALEPTIHTKDVNGQPITLGSHSADKPQFVYFVLDGCPCSYDAEPLFHDLYKQFKGKIDFVSVTNATQEKGLEWLRELSVPYPVVPDPKENIIHAYGARSSVYSVLISKDGHIAKMWPGYSAGLLHEMNSTMSKLAGIPEKPFDTKYAPTTKATGCAFSPASS